MVTVIPLTVIGSGTALAEHAARVASGGTRPLSGLSSIPSGGRSNPKKRSFAELSRYMVPYRGLLMSLRVVGSLGTFARTWAVGVGMPF